MGLPLGRRLLAAGHEVVACDLDEARSALLGGAVAATPASAVEAAEVAITSLPSLTAIEEVVLGPDGLLAGARPGTTVIEMSTGSPALARRLAAAGEQAGVGILDAPVSGGPRGAEAGTLTIMVGGPEPVVAAVSPLLGCFGTVVRIGGPGAGQAVKLSNNLLAGCAMAALSEACALATAEGIDPEILYTVLTGSTGDSRVLRTRFPIGGVDPLHPSSADYQPMFELDLIAKDLSLAEELARGHALATPMAAAALESYRAAQRVGLGRRDYSAVYLTARTDGGGQPRALPEVEGRRFSEGALRELGQAALARCGAGAAAAAAVLDCLVEADRRGVHTHGLIRLPTYVAQARSGEIAAGAAPVVVHADGPTALVDGRLAFGALTATFALDDAATRALEFGVGATAALNGTHFGAAGHFALQAARRGLVGIVATNTPAAVAPFGGSESRLGNNPISIAAPMPAGTPPFVLDIALSQVSRGAIKLAELAGEAIPEGWALDADGRATTDPAAALLGALLPFGGHKGYGLAIAVELLTSALSGSGISPRLVNTGLTGGAAPGAAGAERGTGSLYLVLDPARFAGRETFLTRMGDLVEELKSTRLAPGFGEVIVPGEPEDRHESLAEAKGVELPAATVEALRALAQSEGLRFPDGLDSRSG